MLMVTFQLIMHCHRFTLNGFLCGHLCRKLQYFCNSDTETKLRHQKGVDCAFLRGTAKFWGSKNENIAFLSNWLIPIFPFTFKELISTVSDLWGHIC